MAINESKIAIMPLIQFLSFDGCPLADAAHTELKQALQICGMRASLYEAVDVLDPLTPASLANWGSPTILVNGEDVAGHTRGDGVSCRIYDMLDQVLSAATIAAAIQMTFNK